MNDGAPIPAFDPKFGRHVPGQYVEVLCVCGCGSKATIPTASVRVGHPIIFERDGVNAALREAHADFYRGVFPVQQIETEQPK